jgi:hypothetical protein
MPQTTPSQSSMGGEKDHFPREIETQQASDPGNRSSHHYPGSPTRVRRVTGGSFSWYILGHHSAQRESHITLTPSPGEVKVCVKHFSRLTKKKALETE